jgi:DNA topoisomerase-1
MKEYIIRKIKSKRNGKYTYEYLDMDNNKINKSLVKSLLENIYIPPAYNNVKINLNKKDKILAIGFDEKKRPQYIYNKNYVEKRKISKFNHMIKFGESYNKILSQIKRDLYTEDDNKNKQIAMALLLVIECGIRIGNKKYENENKSFGSTTLKSKHVTVKRDTVSVNFIGKKGVRNKGKVRSKKLSRNIRKKKRTINKDDSIFTYRKGNCWHELKSSDVNSYLKEFGDFTSKNFRTLIANLNLIHYLSKSEENLNKNEKNKFLNKSLEKVSEKMNNTKGICKKNYIDPLLIDLYLNDTSIFIRTFKKCTSRSDINKEYIKLLKKYQ